MSIRTAMAVMTHELSANQEPDEIAPRWCVECSGVAMLVRAEKAAELAFTDLQTIYRWVELRTVHFFEAPHGVTLICLDSLLN